MSHLIEDGFGDIVSFSVVLVSVIAVLFLTQGLHHTLITPKFMQNRVVTLSYIYIGWTLLITSGITYFVINPNSSEHLENVLKLESLEKTVYEEIALDALNNYDFKEAQYLRLEDTSLPLGLNTLDVDTKEMHLHNKNVLIVTSAEVKENIVVPFNSDKYPDIKKENYIDIETIDYVINLVDYKKGSDAE